MIAVWVACGAVLGAPARYLIDRAVQSRHQRLLPYGTLTVNLIACFVLGVLTGVGSSASAALAAFLGTGLCATLSTYSTFGFETMRLIERDRRTAFTYVVVSVVAGCAVAALGWWLAA